MNIRPYLFFDGHCEEAINHYSRILGAKVVAVMRYKESPETPPPGMIPENWGEKIMHANLAIGDTSVMASDSHHAAKDGFHGFSLSIALDDEAKGASIFQALSDGGQIQMPFGKTFFAKAFGMVVDKFGVSWMVHVS